MCIHSFLQSKAAPADEDESDGVDVLDDFEAQMARAGRGIPTHDRFAAGGGNGGNSAYEAADDIAEMRNKKERGRGAVSLGDSDSNADESEDDDDDDDEEEDDEEDDEESSSEDEDADNSEEDDFEALRQHQKQKQKQKQIKHKPEPAPAPAPAAKPGFIQSKKFAGSKRGYVFKRDRQGIGYYWDTAKNGPLPKQPKQQQSSGEGKSVWRVKGGASQSSNGGNTHNSMVEKLKALSKTPVDGGGAAEERNVLGDSAADQNDRQTKKRKKGKNDPSGLFAKEQNAWKAAKRERQRQQEAKDAEIKAKLAHNKEKKAKRLEKSRSMSRRNKRGMPNMGATIDHILQKLKKND